MLYQTLQSAIPRGANRIEFHLTVIHFHSLSQMYTYLGHVQVEQDISIYISSHHSSLCQYVTVYSSMTDTQHS